MLELGIMPELAQAVEKLDWLLPTEIQAEAIPLILGGGDVLIAAETGSGKTGAFCLPVIQIVWETLNGKTTHTHNDTQARKWCLSFTDRGQDLALSSDYLTVQSKSGSWQGCRAQRGIKRVRSSLVYNMHRAYGHTNQQIGEKFSSNITSILFKIFTTPPLSIHLLLGQRKT